MALKPGTRLGADPDGRFLINIELESAASSITLILNWNPGAKQ